MKKQQTNLNIVRPLILQPSNKLDTRIMSVPVSGTIDTPKVTVSSIVSTHKMPVSDTVKVRTASVSGTFGAYTITVSGTTVSAKRLSK